MKKSLITAAFAAVLPATSNANYNTAHKEVCITLPSLSEFCSAALRVPYQDNKGTPYTTDSGAPLFYIPDGRVTSNQGKRENCSLLVDENNQPQMPPMCFSPEPGAFTP